LINFDSLIAMMQACFGTSINRKICNF